MADLGSDSTPEILWRNNQSAQEVIWQLNGSRTQTYQLPDVGDAKWSVKPFAVASILACRVKPWVVGAMAQSLVQPMVERF